MLSGQFCPPVTTSPEKHEPRQVRITETAGRPCIRLLSAYARKRPGMQTRAFSLPARFPAWRSAAARPGAAVRSWHQTSPAAGQIMCLRLTGELCAGTADALLDAVDARVRAAVPPACEVVLDLSGTSAIDDDCREALRSLCGLLVSSRARLRIVLPEAEARAALSNDASADSLGPDALHPSVRAAILAAHAALPGPAFITPAMRTLLRQPPEPLPLP